MLTEVLNAQNYQSSLFALPPFVTASVLLALGFMIRDREQRSRISTSFCIMTTTGALWLYSDALMFCALTESVALFWSRVGQVGVNFIPAAAYHSSVASAHADPKSRRRVWLAWQLAIGFSLTLLLPDGFHTGVQLHWWGYYPVYDWLGTVSSCTGRLSGMHSPDPYDGATKDCLSPFASPPWLQLIFSPPWACRSTHSATCRCSVSLC